MIRTVINIIIISMTINIITIIIILMVRVVVGVKYIVGCGKRRSEWQKGGVQSVAAALLRRFQLDPGHSSSHARSLARSGVGRGCLPALRAP